MTNTRRPFVDSTINEFLGIVGKDGKRVENSIQLSSVSSMYARLIDYVPTPCYTHDVSRLYTYLNAVAYPWDVTRSHDCRDRRRKLVSLETRNPNAFPKSSDMVIGRTVHSSFHSFLSFSPSLAVPCGWIPEMRANERIMDSARGACDRR